MKVHKVTMSRVGLFYQEKSCHWPFLARSMPAAKRLGWLLSLSSLPGCDTPPHIPTRITLLHISPSPSHTHLPRHATKCQRCRILMVDGRAPGSIEWTYEPGLVQTVRAIDASQSSGNASVMLSVPIPPRSTPYQEHTKLTNLT